MTTGAPEFQGALVRLADALSGETKKVTKALARLDQRDAMRYATDAYPEIASPFLASAGDFAATWYEDQAPALDYIAAPAELPEVEQLAANARWALTQQDPAGALEGSARRQTFNQARETVLNNADAEPGTKWVRHARSGACGFCRMLATRPLTEGHGGAPGLYRSEATASRNTHTKFEVGHDRCRCIIVPLRPGAQYVAPDYLPQWLDDYYAVSRDADGRLLPPQTIADRMEAIGRERGDFGDKIHRARGEVQPDVVNLDQPARTSVRHLTDRNADRAVEIVQPVADRAAQARRAAERADRIASTTATVTGRTKTVVDVADRLLGGTYPGIRATKQLVDAADKAAQSAAGVTGKAATVTRVAERTLRDTTAIAHGAKQIVDGATSVIDETAAIALAGRGLLADAGKAAADAKGAGKLSDRARAATAEATRIREEATALVDRARATVEQARNTAAAAGELPTRLSAPLRDLQSLANHVQDTAAAAQMAGADAGALAAQVRQLADGIRDARRAAKTPEPPGPPVRVQSERLDRPAELPLEPLDVEVVDMDAPAGQLAIQRSPAPLALETRPALKELTAGPDQPAVPNPPDGAIADWLEAEADHLGALERIREADRVAEVADDATRAGPLPAEMPDPIAAGVNPELIAAVEDQAPAIATKGDQLRARIQEAEAAIDTPDGRKNPSARQRAQRKDARALELRKARQALADAEADGTIDEPIAAPKPKRAKSRPLADVEAERRAAGDAAIQKAVDDFEKAVASGDDDAIEFALTHMDTVEQAEMARRAAVDEQLAKIAEKHARQRARREAAAEAEQRAIYDEMADLVGEDASIAEYHQAEAQVIARRTGKDEQSVLESIRKREFMRTAEVAGNGFEDTLKSVFRYEVHKAYQLAEAETNGVMVSRKSEGKFDPLNLWYCSDATARKHMSEEMANWFDANGRITLPVMRQMILDGDDNFRRRTVQNADFLQ